MAFPLLVTTASTCKFSTKRNHLFLGKIPRSSTTHHSSCICSERDENTQRSLSKSLKPEKYLSLDPRDVLLGIGGLYGATFSFSSNKAEAKPIQPPNLADCGSADLPAGASPTNCCRPYTNKIVDFKLPPKSSPLRIRRPAHLVDDEYVAKYARAVALMKQLDPSDPRSFLQQANTHCAYCGGGFKHVEVL